MFSILIVDDNISDRVGIKRLIDWEALNIEVIGLAVDGLEGYQQAVELLPDFILTDVSMPVLDGIKMTEKIKAELPDIKFIFMSCFDDFEYLKDAISLEVHGYILKPINLAELTSTIEKVIKLKQAEMDKVHDDHMLRRQIQESMPVLQEQLIRDLLYGKLDGEEDIRHRMAYLGMDFADKCYSVLFLQIDNYDLLYADITVENKHFMIYRVQQCVEETIMLEMHGYVTNQQNNSLAIILILDLAERADAINQIVNRANQCKEYVKDKLDLPITIGISDLSTSIMLLPKAFESAQYAVTSKFFSSGNRIIMANEVQEPEREFQYNILEIKSKLDWMIESGQSQDIITFIDHLFNTELHYPPAFIKSLTYSIINVVQTYLIERNESFGSIFGDDLIVWSKLQKFETITDIKQWMIQIIDTVRNFFAKVDSGRYQKIVDDIKWIIEERYAEIENVGQIVSSLYISSSHANLIFKQQTGHTIFDYLIIKRMEAAKQMLQDPYIKIYEIAEKTGYKTASYFAAVFKEYTGLTSKQYRDNTRSERLRQHD
ncbi:DNA-binding response regulator [Paenibacillus baekrokdamisoli]|uniref:DNA-binding response regulator n=1 Tax=Paenibacillus baekrokdamisoli TaxID=1712516 RepID=A0A3G9J7E9_9BACL|nr:response regulator [Paenibacillus baekrokdamisoli]MBB3071763.1 two-component system response regulator YesN [Paenibacillus baekrokdamisoli]BBH24255.1 DNA-binding response regulator [Paenibacillus baekrokdamisoli]